MYSDKVLEHFRNPRNVGEIPDADGIGEVGNAICGDMMTFYIKVENDRIVNVKFKTFGCLPPDEKIVKNPSGLSPIAAFSKDSYVINSIGKSTFITETYKRNFSGYLLKIIPFVSPYNSIRLTPNHPVLAIKRKLVPGARISISKCSWLRISEKKLKKTEPDFYPASTLKTGDYIVYPILNKVIDDKNFTIPVMRLIGYYLSEGYITAKGNAVNFSFNKNEKKYIQDVKNIIYTITKKSPNQKIRNNVCEIYICSKKLADFLSLHCGKLARHKKLSEKIMYLPFKKQWELIKTYHAGDGDIFYRRKKDYPTYRIITTSENLAFQIQQIFARGGIFASISELIKKNCCIEGRKLKDSKQYKIIFKLKRKHKFVHYHENKKFFLVPIRKIEKLKYSGKVYNIQVAFEPNTYLVKGFAVHNCGAAIAVSSMISEMAKGKTLDEALKITNKDVAEELGGLPPNKLHCSNLGADALHAAIKNYLAKKFASAKHDHCPYCDNPLEDELCKLCKQEFKRCPNCNILIPKNATSCPHCKTNL